MTPQGALLTSLKCLCHFYPISTYTEASWKLGSFTENVRDNFFNLWRYKYAKLPKGKFSGVHTSVTVKDVSLLSFSSQPV
jgi:hypothetical protein